MLLLYEYQSPPQLFQMLKSRVKSDNRVSLGRSSRRHRQGVKLMVLRQGKHQQGTLEGKEPSGNHTGAAGEAIFQ